MFFVFDIDFVFVFEIRGWTSELIAFFSGLSALGEHTSKFDPEKRETKFRFRFPCAYFRKKRPRPPRPDSSQTPAAALQRVRPPIALTLTLTPHVRPPLSPRTRVRPPSWHGARVSAPGPRLGIALTLTLTPHVRPPLSPRTRVRPPSWHGARVSAQGPPSGHPGRASSGRWSPEDYLDSAAPQKYKRICALSCMLATWPLVGRSSQAYFLLRNSAMDDSIGGS